MSILVAGGYYDPNLAVLIEAAAASSIEVIDLRLGAQKSPSFQWDLVDGKAWLNGTELSPAGVFFRYDVFGSLHDTRPAVAIRAMGWYQTIFGWVLANPRIHLLNRHMKQTATNKPICLWLAQQTGLAIPETVISNDLGALSQLPGEDYIAKPVSGGGYCHLLKDAWAETKNSKQPAALPAIVQTRLNAPEIRIYVIGNERFAFEVRSTSLDYRQLQDAELFLLDDTPSEADALSKLMSQLGMDFGAADFKTDPHSKRLIFLELNTSPMFARFDQVANGRLSAALVRLLIGTA